MAYVNCECGFVKNEIPDEHIGKKAKCPKCGKGVFVEQAKNPESVPMAIQLQPSAITGTAIKPELKNIINTDVLKAILKDYKDKIPTFKFNKFKFNKVGLNKKEIIWVTFFALLFIAMGLHNIWQSTFVKKYFFKKEIVVYLKEQLHDPDSLKIFKWGEIISVKEKVRKEYPTLFENVYWEFEVRYSAMNQLGGRASKIECFLFNTDGKIIKTRDECLIKGGLFK